MSENAIVKLACHVTDHYLCINGNEYDDVLLTVRYYNDINSTFLYITL